MQIWEMSRQQKNKLLTYLMYKAYQAECLAWTDGTRRHPDGLTFEQWVDNILEEE